MPALVPCAAAHAWTPLTTCITTHACISQRLSGSGTSATAQACKLRKTGCSINLSPASFRRDAPTLKLHHLVCSILPMYHCSTRTVKLSFSQQASGSRYAEQLAPCWLRSS